MVVGINLNKVGYKMDNASLEDLIRNRYNLNMFEGLAIVSIQLGFDSKGNFYEVDCLLYTDYKQEKLERKVFKLRY
ncbi:hypothetical protein NVP1161O_120 [Vibrio phage 1.161.O._10N.261.48.C5]|nr:hypothetical protein NVP1161O_120 [Vibrio phage 1.161.O._10N.261.48.C5]